jgi:hydroxymethylpyrimidine pyrophosphatase-like HAD family hydrolase/orotate phosphoribosyltransferase
LLILKEERDFYESQRWVLMPFLSLEQITERLRLLIDQDIDSLPEWCRNEWRINLYVLSSAVADIVDDYLVRGILDFSKLADYISFAGKPVRWIRNVSLVKSWISGGLRDRKLRQFRRLWREWLIFVCMSLVRDQVPDLNEQRHFKENLLPLLQYHLPQDILTKRTRIPAAYRSQDLTHHDFIELSRKYAERHGGQKSPLVIVGLRTAGSFITPLMCAYLRKEGFQQTTYMTLRPKSYVHPWDRGQFAEKTDRKTRFILVDEPPSTGKSIARCVEILKSSKIDPARITIAVPVHPAGKDWLDASLRQFLQGIEIVTLEHQEWYKEKMMNLENFQNAIRPYFQGLDSDDFTIEENEKTRKINEKLMQNPDKAFHIRLKRVYQVIHSNKSKPRETLFVLGKSVGWGWLGYHAALSALSLEGYVPKVFGVRDGIMYCEWIEDSKEIDNLPIKEDKIVERMSDYISSRTNRLKLEEDPASFLSSYREGGLQSIAIILSNVFGPKVSKLKRGWVRRQLEETVCPVPALVDSRMTKDEWVQSLGEYKKTDFEHHGFSKTATHNISDPAYDIASASFEFELTDEEKDRLINLYIQKTGDKSIRERLFYYKLLVGNEAMDESIRKLNQIRDPSFYALMNWRYIRAWSYLVSETMHQTATFCGGRPVKQWGSLMFVMDIDDVLDKNIFGFPGTTANGVRSLSLLREHGVCSIINTARSLEEVKDYCRYYGFPGGIAEYGSVIWDDLEQREEILVGKNAIDELRILREALSKVPGVFVNPLYQHSIRAYCYNRQRTSPVPDATIGEVFSTLGIRELTAKKSYIDTAIYDKSVDKGMALIKLKEAKKVINCKIGAVGDSESDLPMLIAADKGFLVNNSSIELKRKARNFSISIMRSSFESGLLEAVNCFLHDGSYGNCHICKECLKAFENNTESFWQFLRIADMSAIQHWVRTLDMGALELFRD